MAVRDWFQNAFPAKQSGSFPCLCRTFALFRMCRDSVDAKRQAAGQRRVAGFEHGSSPPVGFGPLMGPEAWCGAVGAQMRDVPTNHLKSRSDGVSCAMGD